MGRRVRVAHRSESEQDFRFFLPRAGAQPPERAIYRTHYVRDAVLAAGVRQQSSRTY
jgi:hypothetical protein